MEKLTQAQVRAANAPGRYGDSDGLYLYVGKAGNRSWVQRIVIDGKRRDLGLGKYPDGGYGPQPLPSQPASRSQQRESPTGQESVHRSHIPGCYLRRARA